jgi:DNA-directed RNA polymerase specialized sigma24 family protein
VSAEQDSWLCRRAGQGDERSFELLLAGSRTKLRDVCSTFEDSTTSLDDCYSIVTLKLWKELQAGRYDPHRGQFLPFASTIAHQALRDDKQRRRAQRRWADEPPASYEQLSELGWETPSWSLAVDPLRVVLAREAFAEAVGSLTRAQLHAVNAYVTTDSGHPAPVVTAFTEARRRVRPLLFEPAGRALRLV